MKNTQTRVPDEVNESLQAREHSPYILWPMWFLWLIFLTPPIVALFLAHPALPRLIITLIGIALFVCLYLWGTWRNAQSLSSLSSSPAHMDAAAWLITTGLVILSVALEVLVHWSGNGNVMLEPFIFTSAYLGGRLSTVRAIVAVIMLILLMFIVGRIINISWSDLGQGTFFVAVVPIVLLSIIRSIKTNQELRVAREEIARLAVTTERLRIARDLHDLLGHNLSLIALKSELARRLISVAPERATIEIGVVENVARMTLQEVREAVAAYRQPTLASELHGTQEILAAAGIAYQYEGDESTMSALPPAIEAVLAWSVREGVTNVIRHSCAHQCTIRVMRDRQTADVEVIDDGVACTGGTGKGGNGLRGLAERVATLGGRFDAGPRVSEGFRLAVSVPLVQRNHDTESPNGSSAASRAQSVPVAVPESSDRYVERSE